MDSRYRTLNITSLTEVEAEVDFLIDLIGDRVPTSDEEKQVMQLIGLAQSLGSRRIW